jgi:hypothetical protein
METFILIALLKTPGEGGAIQRAFDTEAECRGFGAALEAQFEALPHKVPPTVLWTCVPYPTAGE